MARLGSGLRLEGGIDAGARVSASFQIFALKMLLHFAGITLVGNFLWG